jgi:group I intron endonuclease
MVSGIYAVLNLVSGKVYVGSSVDVHGRLAAHKIALARGTHDNSHLQGSWVKYGGRSFSFDVVEECFKEELLEREQFYIDVLDSMNPSLGYNQKGAERRGEVSEISREKWRRARLGKVNSPETRLRMCLVRKGKPKSVAHREKIAEANRARAWKLRDVPLSPSHRSKIAEANRGSHRTLETRARMSKAQMGNRKTRGQTRSPETRARMSAAQKKWRWANGWQTDQPRRTV